MEGNTTIDQVRDKAVLAAFDKAASSGFINRKKFCFNCKPFVGLITGVTQMSCDSHMSPDCPHKKLIADTIAKVQLPTGKD
jgi:hypothetical protein